MALEELIGKAETENLSGKSFGIDYSHDYGREEFVRRAGDLFDIEEYYVKLKENINDTDALNDAIGLAINYMAGDKKANKVILQENHNLVLDQADLLYGSGSVAMARYVEKNRKTFLDKLNEKQLYAVFQRTPSYITGNKEYDKIKVLKEKASQIAEAFKEGKDISAIIQDEFEELLERIPEEQKVFIMRNKDLVLPILMNSLANRIQRTYRGLFKDEQDNLQKGKIKEYLKENYKAVEKFIKDEIPAENEKEKLKMWDKNLKIHYIELARELYRTEKEEQKFKDNKELEERKSKSKSFGIKT